jgi:hypothetical protein
MQEYLSAHSLSIALFLNPLEERLKSRKASVILIELRYKHILTSRCLQLQPKLVKQDTDTQIRHIRLNILYHISPEF